MSQKRLLSSLLLLTALFSVLRCFHLNSDFPSSDWEPGFALTDEGWYTRAAATAVLQGQWHLDGDFNPAVDVPFLSIINYLPFKFFGVSVLTARAVNVFFAICSIWLVFFLVRDFESDVFAAVCALVLASSSFWFDYSRVAVLEFPMTALVLLSCIIGLQRGNDYLIGLVAGLVFFCAVLTKWTALALAPAMWVLIAGRFHYSRASLRRILLSAVVLTTGILTYKILVGFAYETDHAYFYLINVTRRVHLGPLYWSLFRSLYHARFVGVVVYVAAVVTVFFYIVYDRTKLFQALRAFSCIWFALFIAALTYAHNQPPRYYPPLLVPLTIIFVYGCKSALSSEASFVRNAVIALIAGVIVWNGSIDGARIAKPRYSMLGMEHDIARILFLSETKQPLLLGHFANTITLESHVASINSSFAPGNFESRIKFFRPTHYAAVDGTEANERAVLQREFYLEEKGLYTVEGSALIRLYCLRPRNPILLQP